MTNLIAFVLGLMIIGAIAADYFLTGGSNLVFLAIKFTEFTEWIAFWR